MTRHDITRFAVAALATLAACTARTGPVPATGMPRVAVVPKPVSLQERGGAPFSLRDSTWIVTDAGGDADVTRVANMLAMLLRAGSGHTVNVGDAGTPMTRGQIRLKLDGARSDLGDEGYTLAVTPDSVAIVARRPAGVFYGVQTLRQLFPYQVEQDMALADTSIWKVPAVSVTDRPRFTWRGAMLDVSRHFFTVDEVKQYIDLLALYKMNRLHLHLSDDQGWRIEIKSRPQLTGTSSATQVGGGPGGFYTQADYADIVRYAADRFITIVPEIEMPAHINALLYAFPQVNCGKKDVGNYTGTNVGFSAICPDTAETWAILDDVIREVAGMTPGPWFHIGGDEVQALTPQQYATFIEHAQSIVNKYGKTMIGWDEIQKSRLVPSSIVQMWRPESEKMSAGGQK
ncbi:MAG TPA: beta-N-acetylhexosaminidase, partial [Gemmatimonadaceae bacterium]|nr:beta-N-acetylhexosaminidase [Gemmatimonadaceae bacterium]